MKRLLLALAGGLLLLTRRVKSQRIYAEIDWSLLLMFAGLFIIVAGAQRALLTPDLIAHVSRLRLCDREIDLLGGWRYHVEMAVARWRNPGSVDEEPVRMGDAMRLGRRQRGHDDIPNRAI